ncbi:hypothetical protein GUITHDRAFT_148317 [Guillardia theta CCMP2712]|uniref:Uncharacterized protein n=1 Tax=Guillardia theta (strain CCMP2712) TaxID=905079 RepID=L1I9V9_GUITC|nr:hypothetical protein GUITHDRAFT_148317 [Guillardia theta CCMP2712]EKX32867.1 hypothetical protein GUITHDRAFT_148317 [Guillardia theta CCMP2712]|eukprot:XP_005819847.1 hypothetical protein GUITHDRAFT_148317 [Guillardia theta CCMP2712]
MKAPDEDRESSFSDRKYGDEQLRPSSPYNEDEDMRLSSFKSLRPFSNFLDGQMSDRYIPNGIERDTKQPLLAGSSRFKELDELLMHKDRELEAKDQKIRSLQAEIREYKEEIRALEQQKGSYPRFMDLPSNIRPEDVEDAFRLRATAEQAASEGADMLEKALESMNFLSLLPSELTIEKSRRREAEARLMSMSESPQASELRASYERLSMENRFLKEKNDELMARSMKAEEANKSSASTSDEMSSSLVDLQWARREVSELRGVGQVLQLQLEELRSALSEQCNHTQNARLEVARLQAENEILRKEQISRSINSFLTVTPHRTPLSAASHADRSLETRSPLRTFSPMAQVGINRTRSAMGSFS